MNSYPIELLAQYAPLMFVAGLTEGAQAPQSPSSSHQTNLNNTPSSPIQSPKSQPDGPSLNGRLNDPFESLISRLRTTMATRRKGTVWDTERGKSFQVILVDKNIRFPPRKIQPTSPRQDGSPVQHPQNYGPPRSPLSPLTPSSPLYPDGLIAPIWVRKHIELVPSVFVLFLRLSESPAMASPLEGRQEIEKEEERKRDAELAAEILQRKKTTSERGIKLTVVLLASRRMLDDPSLDTRLSFIRRQSNLDTRAALFVLSPVSQPELADFVKSLQSALYESAKDYYAAHSKRIRRKRHRQPQANATILPNANGALIGRPLREIGWIVRYEYKLALFAEFRMEEELARKHYEDCWSALVEMFGSTAILPPRTKRWAEAKVLADCIAIKLCKLYLYSNECSMAMSVFNRHLHKFADLSKGWGIGEETFEFWSWMARQHRILAELLELALRAGFKIPVIPTPTAAALGAAGHMVGGYGGVNGTKESLAFSMGLNPANILQHPGYHYYTAAKCTLQRYERFLAILEQETAQPGTMSQSPGFANEKKVEHHAVVIELYIKAYELFKKFRTGQSRQTVYIAHRIAETYYASGNYDAAIRFFERIARMYRREQWSDLLKPILSMWYDCARQSGDIELTIKLLIEIMGSNVVQDEEEHASLPDDLVAILKNSPLPSPESSPLTIDLPESPAIFDCGAVFWRSDVSVGESAPFQLFVASPSNLSLSSLPITSLRIYFGGDHSPIVVSHTAGGQSDDVRRVNVGHMLLDKKTELNTKANLRWNVGQTQVFAGTVTSMVPLILKVSKVVFVLKEGDWTIEIPIHVHTSQNSTFKPRPALAPPRWLSSLSDQPARFIPVYRTNSSTTNVRPKPHLLDLQFEHPSPAYMNERYPIQMNIKNNDERELELIVDVLLQPSEDESVNRILFEDQESTSLIKGLSFGTVAPGQIVTKTMFLVSSGTPGNRILDISIQSKAICKSPSFPTSTLSPHDSPASDTSETLETLMVPVKQPITSHTETAYHRLAGPLRSLLDLTLFDHGVFNPSVQAITTTKIGNDGPWDLEIGKVVWKPVDVAQARLFDTSMDPDDDSLPLVLPPRDYYAIVSRYNLALDESVRTDHSIPCPGHLEVSWKREGADSFNTTVVALPSFNPPQDGIIGILLSPATAKLHQPVPITLTIQNRQAAHTADLILQTESSEAFVIAGPRSCRLPTLLPSTSVDVRFNVVPLMCGMCRLPTFKVFDRRRLGLQPQDSEGEETIVMQPVPIVDERWDLRRSDKDEKELPLHVPASGGLLSPRDGVVIVVLPTT
ncbi:hypothetical protein FRC03_009851 [Tulasnella sp. 419]|nr:hypothetical protein FRC03_009851 [Tulasnella sp. 419]